jgi:hypothetical protein
MSVLKRWGRTVIVGGFGFVLGSIAQGAIQKMSEPAVLTAQNWVRSRLDSKYYVWCVNSEVREPSVTVCVREDDSRALSINGEWIKMPDWSREQ